MKINVVKTVQVEAKTLSIFMKVVDTFSATLKDKDGSTLKEYEGYVPAFMPDEADSISYDGHYLILDIDIDTGLITNWRKLTPGDIEEFIKGSDNK